MAANRQIAIGSPLSGQSLAEQAKEEVEDLDARSVNFLGTSAGTSTAYTAAANPPLTIVPTRMSFAFIPHVDCGNNPNIVISGTAAISLRHANGSAILQGQLKAGILAQFMKVGAEARLVDGGASARILSLQNRAVYRVLGVAGTGAAYTGTTELGLPLADDAIILFDPHVANTVAFPTLALNDGSAVTLYPIGIGELKPTVVTPFVFFSGTLVRFGEATLSKAEAEAADAALAEQINAAQTVQPGYNPAGFTRSTSGAFESLIPLDGEEENIVVDSEGAVIRIVGADQIAARAAVRLEHGRFYQARGVVRRRVDTPDPSNNTVQLALRWLNKDQVAIGSPREVNVDDLLVSSGRTEISFIIASAAGAGVDYVWPASAIFARPYLKTFGTGDEAETDFELISLEDVTLAQLSNIATFESRLGQIESENLPERMEDVEAQVAGSEIARFKTRTAAAAATIPAAVDIVETLGKTGEGDGFGGVYKRAVQPYTPTPEDFVSVDGEEWRLQFYAHAPETLLATRAAIAALNSALDFGIIRTAGRATVGDGGEQVFKPVGVEPATIGVPAFHKTQDYNGNWKETITRSRLTWQEAEIVSDSATDNTGVLNEASAWLGRKGGGKLLLPASISGAIRCFGRPEIVHAGVMWEGASVGGNANGFGTILYLTPATPGPKMYIGPDSVDWPSAIALKDLRILGGGANGPLLELRHAREMRFSNLSAQNFDGGFMHVGTTTREAYGLWLRAVDFTGSGVGCHGLYLRNCPGGLFMSDSVFAGPDPADAGVAAIIVPAGAISRPDGMNIGNCGFVRFDRGMEISHGGANWFITNTFFDGMQSYGIFLAPSTDLGNFRFTDGHIHGKYAAGSHGAYGVYIASAGGAVQSILIADSFIQNFGINGVYVGGSERVKIHGNHILSSPFDTNNAQDAVVLAAGANFASVQNNTIGKGAATNQARYGINIVTTHTHLIVEGNHITDWGTAAIFNPNRGPAATRKVQNNSGQIFEGRIVTEEYSLVSVPGTTTATMNRIGAPDAYFSKSSRRRKLVGLSLMLNGARTAGTMTVNGQKEGVTAMSVAISTNTDNARVEAPTVAEVDFAPGNQFTPILVTAGFTPAATVEAVVSAEFLYD